MQSGRSARDAWGARHLADPWTVDTARCGPPAVGLTRRPGCGAHRFHAGEGSLPPEGHDRSQGSGGVRLSRHLAFSLAPRRTFVFSASRPTERTNSVTVSSWRFWARLGTKIRWAEGTYRRIVTYRGVGQRIDVSRPMRETPCHDPSPLFQSQFTTLSWLKLD